MEEIGVTSQCVLYEQTEEVSLFSKLLDVNIILDFS